MSETIRIKYHVPDMTKLENIGGAKSDWIDLRASERVVMRKGDFKLISLGVSMQLPKGYEAHILPRSSTMKNFGIIMACSQGIVDESYKGDNDIWMFPAIAVRDTIIEKDSRICQFRIYEHQPQIEFEEVEVLGNEDRNGIGSSGVL